MQSCKAEFPPCKGEFTCLAHRGSAADQSEEEEPGGTPRPAPTTTNPRSALFLLMRVRAGRSVVVGRGRIRAELQQQGNNLGVVSRGHVKRSRTGPRPRADVCARQRPGPE